MKFVSATSRRTRVLLALVVAFALLTVVGAWVAYRYAEQVEIRTLRDTAAHRLDGYENALTSEVRHYSYLPSLASLNADVLLDRIASIAIAHMMALVSPLRCSSMGSPAGFVDEKDEEDDPRKNSREWPTEEVADDSKVCTRKPLCGICCLLTVACVAWFRKLA